MSGKTTSPRSGRKARTLDEEVTTQREKLRKLEERQREQQRKERERSQKAVMELIETERFDAIPSNLWCEAMPKIKVLLVVDAAKPTEPITPVQTAPEVTATAETNQWTFSANPQAPVPSTEDTQISQGERAVPGFPQKTSCGKLEKREGLWSLWETRWLREKRPGVQRRASGRLPSRGDEIGGVDF